MGNNQTSRVPSVVQSIELTQLCSVSMSALKMPANRVKSICFADKLNTIFVAYKKSKKVHKFNLYMNKLEETYRFNSSPIKLIELNRMQNRLYICDRTSIILVDCEKNTHMTQLFSYQEEDCINVVKMFNNRFIVVSLKNSSLFEVFDTKTGIKEALVYNKNKIDSKVSFRSFGCSSDNEYLMLLDFEYLYLFDMQSMKEINRRFHKKKETDILHITKDKRYVFTMSSGYIVMRRLKSLEKTKKFKFKKFEKSKEVIFMQNEKAIMIAEPDGVRFIEILTLQSICFLEQPGLSYANILKNNKFLINMDATNILIYGFKGHDLSVSRSTNLLETPSNKQINKRTLKLDFTDNYKKIGMFVKQGKTDAALLECRKIMRKNDREHKAYFITGKLLFIKNYFDEALEFISQAIHLSSQKNATYFIWRGKVFYCLYRYKEAIEAFNKALILDPEKKSAAKNIEIVQKKLKELKNSLVLETDMSYPSFPTEVRTSTINTFDFENMFDKAFSKTKSKDDKPAFDMSLKVGKKIKSETDANAGLLNKALENTLDLWNFIVPFSKKDTGSSNDINVHALENLPKKQPRPLIDKSYANFIDTDEELSIESEDNDEYADIRFKFSAPMDIGGHTSKMYPMAIQQNSGSTKNETNKAKILSTKKQEFLNPFVESETFFLMHPTHMDESLKFLKK